jgi:hypothetical protein
MKAVRSSETSVTTYSTISRLSKTAISLSNTKLNERKI